MRRSNVGVPLKAPITSDEEKAIKQLVGELTKLCNERIPTILDEKELEALKKFEITILAVSLQFGCDEKVANEMKARAQNFDETNLTYFG